MKTILPEKISTIAQAEAFLRSLYQNNEAFHPDERAENVITWVKNDQWKTAFSKRDAKKLNELMEDISELEFDPCEFLLSLQQTAL